MTGVTEAKLKEAFILIHTSVKLVTIWRECWSLCKSILIHTSVKLVTCLKIGVWVLCRILIHTSVKLVTESKKIAPVLLGDFNPHEREARDYMANRA